MVELGVWREAGIVVEEQFSKGLRWVVLPKTLLGRGCGSVRVGRLWLRERVAAAAGGETVLTQSLPLTTSVRLSTR